MYLKDYDGNVIDISKFSCLIYLYILYSYDSLLKCHVLYIWIQNLVLCIDNRLLRLKDQVCSENPNSDSLFD